MNELTFAEILKLATGICSGKITQMPREFLGFCQLFSFATEIISKYIYEFELNNKSLLTVGSSSDQSVNASLLGCKNQTIYDICPFTKFYYYLKVAGIIVLSLEEFLNFFSYASSFHQSIEPFSKKVFIKVESILKELDFDSYVFWSTLFESQKPDHIRGRLFTSDEHSIELIRMYNLYLASESEFKKTKSIIVDTKPKFITGDMFDVNIDDNCRFDNIFLSNIASRSYMSNVEYKEFIDKLSLRLAPNGRILLSYIYGMLLYKRYQPSIRKLLENDTRFKLYGNDIEKVIEFLGVNGYQENNKEHNDHVIIYKKAC